MSIQINDLEYTEEEIKFIIKKHNNKYYHNNKDKINKKRFRIVKCPNCGCNVKFAYRKRHMNTQKCKRIFNEKNNFSIN